MVAIGLNSKSDSLSIVEVYEKIGNIGSKFSDDCIFDAVSRYDSITECVVDCPVSLPPCLDCIQSLCPGIGSCNDPEVIMMRDTHQQSRGIQRRGNKKHINPQAHRLWDFENLLNASGRKMLSQRTNSIPLTYRARSLQRRLSGLGISLLETSIPHVIEELSNFSSFQSVCIKDYKDFTKGLAVREDFIETLIALTILSQPITEHEWYMINLLSKSPENFQAFLATLVSYLKSRGLIKRKPIGYTDRMGWPILPELARIEKIR